MFGFFKKQQPTSPPPLPQPAPPPAEPPRANAPNHFDHPQNEFEQHIIAFHRKEIGIQQFLESLFNAEIVVLSDHEESKFADGPSLRVEASKLYTIQAPDFEFLSIFSHLSRAKPVVAIRPELRAAIRMSGGELLLGMKGTVGIVLNPGWDIDLHWEPAQVAAIRKTLSE